LGFCLDYKLDILEHLFVCGNKLTSRRRSISRWSDSNEPHSKIGKEQAHSQRNQNTAADSLHRKAIQHTWFEVWYEVESECCIAECECQ